MINNVLPVGEQPDAMRRSCADCSHMKAAVSWWCKNPKAIAARGTAIPGAVNCPFWSPAPVASPPMTLKKFVKRTFGDFFSDEVRAFFGTWGWLLQLLLALLVGGLFCWWLSTLPKGDMSKLIIF